MSAPLIHYGSKRVYLADLLDERGSLTIWLVEWREIERGVETKINGSVLAAKWHPSGGPAPTWSGYIGGAFIGYQADNAQDVQGYLLQRAALR